MTRVFIYKIKKNQLSNFLILNRVEFEFEFFRSHNYLIKTKKIINIYTYVFSLFILFLLYLFSIDHSIRSIENFNYSNHYNHQLKLTFFFIVSFIVSMHIHTRHTIKNEKKQNINITSKFR